MPAPPSVAAFLARACGWMMTRGCVAYTILARALQTDDNHLGHARQIADRFAVAV